MCSTQAVRQEDETAAFVRTNKPAKRFYCLNQATNYSIALGNVER